MKVINFIGVYFLFLSTSTSASGIVLGGSRAIYPATEKQVFISVGNNTEAETYLIQLWVENVDVTKTCDFFVTPPLYTSAPRNENDCGL